MLTGERATTPVHLRVAEALAIAAHAYPFLLMGGGLTFVGLLAIGPRRKDSPELWICLPAGLALLGVFAGIGYWLWWRLPRLTITRFAYDGMEVVIETPAYGRSVQPIGALRSVVESRGRRGVLGWWLRFEGGESVFLHSHTPNGWPLVEQLRAHTKRQHAEPDSSATSGGM